MDEDDEDEDERNPSVDVRCAALLYGGTPGTLKRKTFVGLMTELVALAPPQLRTDDAYRTTRYCVDENLVALEHVPDVISCENLAGRMIDGLVWVSASETLNAAVAAGRTAAAEGQIHPEAEDALRQVRAAYSVVVDRYLQDRNWEGEA